MVVLRAVLSVGFTTSRFCKPAFPSTPLAALISTQVMSRQALTKSLDLVTSGKVRLSRGGAEDPVTLVTDHPRPLVVMLAWMMAKKKHVHKYCDFYLRRGFDVLTVSVSPWQLLWPVTGSQIVAEEILQFLHQNQSCQPLFLHGFSVGGYVWGEVLVKMKQEPQRYQSIIDRIEGQVWDSAADVTEIPVGLPLAVFPKNPLLRVPLTKYIRYHMKVFDEVATSHYIRSSQMFHTTLVHSPALLLLSKTDPVGTASSNLRLKDTWESMGIKVHWKCWDDSKHVSHYLKYKDEYIETLEHFYDSLNKTGKKEEIPGEREVPREKLQAKL